MNPSSLPLGLPFAYQNSPATLLFYMPICRGKEAAYKTLDMRTITSVSVFVRFPDTTTTATWTLLPVSAMSTVERGVFAKAFAPGDTAQLGELYLVATPFVGATPLPPAIGILTIRGPALG